MVNLPLIFLALFGNERLASVANANAPVVIESIMRSMKIPMQKLMADSIKIKKKKSEVSFLSSPYLRR